MLSRMVPPPSRMVCAPDAQPGTLPLQLPSDFRDPSSQGRLRLQFNLSSNSAFVPLSWAQAALPTGARGRVCLAVLDGWGPTDSPWRFRKPQPSPEVVRAQVSAPQSPRGGSCATQAEACRGGVGHHQVSPPWGTDPGSGRVAASSHTAPLSPWC